MQKQPELDQKGIRVLKIPDWTFSAESQRPTRAMWQGEKKKQGKKYISASENPYQAIMTTRIQKTKKQSPRAGDRMPEMA